MTLSLHQPEEYCMVVGWVPLSRAKSNSGRVPDGCHVHICTVLLPAIFGITARHEPIESSILRAFNLQSPCESASLPYSVVTTQSVAAINGDSEAKPVDSICERLIGYRCEVLPPKHARVVAERICLSGSDQPTIQTSADDLCLSRERIRQLQNKGVRRLRSPSRRAAIDEIVVAAVGDVLQNS
jgi:hypothetical protein